MALPLFASWLNIYIATYVQIKYHKFNVFHHLTYWNNQYSSKKKTKEFFSNFKFIAWSNIWIIMIEGFEIKTNSHNFYFFQINTVEKLRTRIASLWEENHLMNLYFFFFVNRNSKNLFFWNISFWISLCYSINQLVNGHWPKRISLLLFVTIFVQNFSQFTQNKYDLEEM